MSLFEITYARHRLFRCCAGCKLEMSHSLAYALNQSIVVATELGHKQVEDSHLLLGLAETYWSCGGAILQDARLSFVSLHNALLNSYPIIKRSEGYITQAVSYEVECLLKELPAIASKYDDVFLLPHHLLCALVDRSDGLSVGACSLIHSSGVDVEKLILDLASMRLRKNKS